MHAKHYHIIGWWETCYDPFRTFFGKSRWCLWLENFFDPVFCFHIKNFCIMPNLLVEVEKQTGTVFNICFCNIETFVWDGYILAFCQINLNNFSSSSQLWDTFIREKTVWNWIRLHIHFQWKHWIYENEWWRKLKLSVYKPLSVPHLQKWTI